MSIEISDICDVPESGTAGTAGVETGSQDGMGWKCGNIHEELHAPSRTSAVGIGMELRSLKARSVILASSRDFMNEARIWSDGPHLFADSIINPQMRHPD